MKEKPVAAKKASEAKVSVTLAYPHPHDAEQPKHVAGETVDLPAAEAKRLIRDGLARPAAPTPNKES